MKYKNFENINFLGKQPHAKLPELLKKYDVNINNAQKGFFDKAVLETCAAGIINFYRSEDFDFPMKMKSWTQSLHHHSRIHQFCSQCQSIF